MKLKVQADFKKNGRTIPNHAFWFQEEKLETVQLSDHERDTGATQRSAPDTFHNLNYKGCPAAGATHVGTVI